MSTYTKGPCRHSKKVCPQCGSADLLRIVTTVQVDIPASLEGELSEKHFRRASVQILDADWDCSAFYCEIHGLVD